MKIWWSVESQYFVASNLVTLAGLASGCFQTAFLVCMCRKLHINSNFIFGNTIVTIGWSTFYPILCPKILLHHQCHCQPPHLFCLQYLWNLKVPPKQELESEGKGSTQIIATQGISYSAGISLLSTWNGFQREISLSSRMPVSFCFYKPN